MAKRKWSNLRGQVPDEPQEVSEREQTVRARVDVHRAKTMSELADEYKTLVEEEDFADRADKARSIEYEALERLILTQLKAVQEFSGHDTWQGDGQSFAPQYTPIPIVVDKTALIAYIREHGMEALLDLGYPKLRSLVTSRLDEITTMTPGQRAVLPPDALSQPLPGVKIFLKTGVRWTGKTARPLDEKE